MKNISQKPHKNTAYILLCGEIEAEAVQQFGALLSQLPVDTDTLYLIMATNGGSVTQGIALYNLLRASQYKLIAHNIANVDSIGNIVFVAAEKRRATSHAVFLIHGVRSHMDEQDMNESGLKEKLSSIEMDNKRIRKIFCERTKLSMDEMERLILDGVAEDSAYALSKGIVDEVVELVIPRGTVLHVVGSEK